MSGASSDYHASSWMLNDDALFNEALRWQVSGHSLAIAFVINTWGSSPRQVGSIMLIRDDQLIAGSVSGGCVEGAVIDAASVVIKSGYSQRLDFGVANADAWEVGLSCGGQISILVMAVSKTEFEAKIEATDPFVRGLVRILSSRIRDLQDKRH